MSFILSRDHWVPWLGFTRRQLQSYAKIMRYLLRYLLHLHWSRNAENQIKALYGEFHTQFHARCNYQRPIILCKISEANEKPARKYCGIMGIGTTATTTLIRVEAALLFATRYLEVLGFKDKVIDITGRLQVISTVCANLAVPLHRYQMTFKADISICKGEIRTGLSGDQCKSKTW